MSTLDRLAKSWGVFCAGTSRACCLLGIVLSCAVVEAQSVSANSSAAALPAMPGATTQRQTSSTYAPENTTRTISRRTYSRRINADGSVTELPSEPATVSRERVVTEPARQTYTSSTMPSRSYSTSTPQSSYTTTSSRTYVTKDRVASSFVEPTLEAGGTISTNPAPRRSYVRSSTEPGRSNVRTETRVVRTVEPSDQAKTYSAQSQPSVAPTRTVTASAVTTPTPRQARSVTTTQPVTQTTYTNRTAASVSAPVERKTVTTGVAEQPTAPASPQTSAVKTPVRVEPARVTPPKRVVQTVSVEPKTTTKPSALPAAATSKTKLSADDVPDVETLHQILWSTLSVMSDSHVQRDYSRFLQILSPRMRQELSDADLPDLFDGLKDQQANITLAVGMQALFEIEPYVTADRHLRLRGAFAVARDEALRFDFLYTNVDGVWFVDAVALANG